MATFTIRFDKRYQSKKNKTYPVKIILSTRKDRAIVDTGIQLLENQWNDNCKHVIEHPQAKLFNKIINQKTTQIESIILNCSIRGIKINTIEQFQQLVSLGDTLFLPDNAEKLTAILTNQPQKNKVISVEERKNIAGTPKIKSKKEKKLIFAKYFTKYISEIKTKSTQEMFQETLDKVNAFIVESCKPESIIMQVDSEKNDATQLFEQIQKTITSDKDIVEKTRKSLDDTLNIVYEHIRNNTLTIEIIENINYHFQKIIDKIENVIALNENSLGAENEIFNRVFENVLELLNKFVSKDTNLWTITFEDINYTWLKRFETHLADAGLVVNSRSIYLRNIRRVFNNAIDEGLIPLDIYPFRRFKIKTEETKKRALSTKDNRNIKYIKDVNCEPYLEQYRDIFMLIFYLIGINIIDLVNLKEISKEGRIEYRRAKTKRLYSIKVEPEAIEIIEKYKGQDYLINVLDRYKNYKDYCSRLNKNLKKLHPVLSTYYARYTWASIASKLDIPKDTIAKALGHGRKTVTDIYIDFDMEKIDEANRKVIDYVKNMQDDEIIATIEDSVNTENNEIENYV